MQKQALESSKRLFLVGLIYNLDIFAKVFRILHYLNYSVLAFQMASSQITFHMLLLTIISTALTQHIEETILTISVFT